MTTALSMCHPLLFSEFRCNSFFFQAEDGIRDLYVTGVQTCALPIYGSRARSATGNASSSTAITMSTGPRAWRSEERRVGKECRARGSPNLCKKYEEEIPRSLRL